MSAITTHILDVSTGIPARDVPVTLERETDEGWEVIGNGTTDGDGRLRDLLDPDAAIKTGNYRLIFETEFYFAEQQIEAFYPLVTVSFTVRDASQHYHVPLLLSPFGYSTYRGS
jgi:5-hydroxyisourate hydrolase